MLNKLSALFVSIVVLSVFVKASVNTIAGIQKEMGVAGQVKTECLKVCKS